MAILKKEQPQEKPMEVPEQLPSLPKRAAPEQPAEQAPETTTPKKLPDLPTQEQPPAEQPPAEQPRAEEQPVEKPAEQPPTEEKPVEPPAETPQAEEQPPEDPVEKPVEQPAESEKPAEPAAPAADAAKKGEEKASPLKKAPRKAATRSFFEGFGKLVAKHDARSERRLRDLGEQDLLAEMKAYHEARRKGKPVALHQEEADELLKEKVEELEGLERRWQEEQERLLETEAALGETEALIAERSHELKHLLFELSVKPKLRRRLRPEEHFILADGRAVTSAEELAILLPELDPGIFAHHVTGERNDFAEWVRHAYACPELAERMAMARTPVELAETLSY